VGRRPRGVASAGRQRPARPSHGAGAAPRTSPRDALVAQPLRGGVVAREEGGRGARRAWAAVAAAACALPRLQATRAAPRRRRRAASHAARAALHGARACPAASRTLVSGQAQQIFFFGLASPPGAGAGAAGVGAAAGSGALPHGHRPMPIGRRRLALRSARGPGGAGARGARAGGRDLGVAVKGGGARGVE
jgi:hypothetical protein